MKWLFLLFFLSAVGGSALAQTDSGSLGDVRYSVVPPATFRSLNGDGWQLMDGRNINGTDLCEELGICQIPDARGVFIRGMNVGRAADTGDPDGDRGIGAYQNDHFKGHSHPLSHNVWVAIQWAGHGHGGLGSENPLSNRSRSPGDNNTQWLATQNVGGNETRPRNIALYTYIKVNQ